MNKQLAIENILDMWFEQTVIRNKDLFFKYEVHNEYLLNQSYRLQKIVKNPNREAFMSDYILQCYLAMTKFEATDEEWEQMAGGNSPLLNQLSKYIYTSVNYYFKRESMEQNGKIMSVDGTLSLVKLPVQSIDVVDKNGDGSDCYSFMDILSEDADLFANLSDEESQHANSFIEWFDTHRDSILTKNQNEFITNLNTVHSTDTKEEVKAKIGIERDQINKKLDRIVNRVATAYNKQAPVLATQQQMQLQGTINLLQPVQSIANRNYSLETINHDIFNYIAENYIEIQPFCKLSVSEHQAISRKEYNTLLTYKLYDILTAKLETEKARLKQKSPGADPITISYNFVKKQKNKQDSLAEKGDMSVFYIVNRDGFMVNVN